MTYFL